MQAYQHSKAPAEDEAQPMTARQRETKIRRELQDLASKRDKHFGYTWGTTNGEFIRRFNKPREEMTESELVAALSAMHALRAREGW